MAIAIAGLREYTAPAGQVNQGRLPLPPEFDQKQFVGKWVKAGPAVQMAKQVEQIPSERLEADGWAVWLDKSNRACQRTLGTGNFVLMFRPKALQRAVSAAYGNASKRRMTDEAIGKTVGGDSNGDSGILPQEKLNRIERRSSDDLIEETFEQNPPRLNKVEVEPVAQIDSNPEPREKGKLKLTK